jgi:tetratricopeptide (TPR) repeat protein
MARALLEEGCLTCEVDGEIRTRSVDEIRIPSTVQEVVAARLDRLPPAAKRVVQHAAVMGRQFSRRLLVALLSSEGIDVDRELDELERRGVVHRRNVFSNDEYRFGESLTQEVAYEGLLLRQRRQLHERIGLLLEDNPMAADSERSAMLMHHFGLSDNRAKSAKALLRAAAEAEKVPSYATAARLYRQAWDLAYDANGRGSDADLQRLALQAVNGVGRMAVIYNVPDPGDNSEVLANARHLAESLDDFGSLAALYTYEGMLLMQRDRAHFADGLARVEKGSELARRAPDPLPAITNARALSYGYMIDGRLEPARQLLDFVIDQLDRTGLSQQLADLHCSASWMRDRLDFFNDDLERATQGTLQTLALASRVGNRTVRSSACMLLGHVALSRGEYAEALRWIEESLSVMAVIGPQWNASTAAAIGLLASRALGRTDNPGRFVDLIAQGSMPSNDLALNSHVVTEALLLAGEVEFAERRAQMAYERSGGRLRELHATLALAAVQLYRGGKHAPDALHSYQHALGLAETLGLRSAIATASSGLAQVELSRGEATQASRLLRRALRLWGELGMSRYEAQATGHLAVIDLGAAPSEATTR